MLSHYKQYVVRYDVAYSLSVRATSEKEALALAEQSLQEHGTSEWDSSISPLEAEEES